MVLSAVAWVLRRDMSRSSSTEADEIASARIGFVGSAVMMAGYLLWFRRADLPLIGCAVGLLVGVLAGWRGARPASTGGPVSAVFRLVLLSPAVFAPLGLLGLWEFVGGFFAWLTAGLGVRWLLLTSKK